MHLAVLRTVSHTRNTCTVSVTAPNPRADFGVLGARRPPRRTPRTCGDVGKDV